MPRISQFHGILISMYHREHPPPHFHAAYSGHEALIEIAAGNVLKGYLPHRALSLVREWAELRRAELMENWERAQTKKLLRPIEPLE